MIFDVIAIIILALIIVILFYWVIELYFGG